MDTRCSTGRKLAVRIRQLLKNDTRNMLFELVRAKFKSSDYNTVLGMLWSLGVPMATLGILYLMFRGRFSVGISHYPLYLLIGIVWLNSFIGATSSILKSFVYNREMLHHSPVPREYIILTEFSVHAYKFFVGLAFCIVISAGCKVLSLGRLLLLAPLVTAYAGFIFGVGCILLCIYCFVNDMEYLWSILTQLCFFITPVFFGLHSVSQVARTLVLYVNPLTVFMLAARNVLINEGAVDVPMYLASLGVGCLFFMIGYLIFIRLESLVVERT